MLEKAFEYIEGAPLKVSGGISVDPFNKKIQGGGRLSVAGISVGNGGAIYDLKSRRLITYRN